MSENTSGKDDSDFETFDRVLRLLREAVNEAGIKDHTEYPQSTAYFYRQWALNEEDWRKSFAVRREKGSEDFYEMYKFESSKDVILLIQHVNITFTTWHEISLFHIANLVFMVAEDELNKPEVEKIFDINSIEERDDAIDKAVKAVLRRLFWALTNLFFQATNRAIHDSVLSYIKTDLKHVYSLHWKKLEYPRNFEYLPHQLLETLNKPVTTIEDWRQRFIGNIREIPEPQLSQLPQRYKELSDAYRVAKKEHKQKKKKFLSASNRHTVAGWREQWKKEFVYYPDLYADCLMLICDDDMILPRQLAYQHLSFDWGYSPDHMRRIINKQKALKKARKKKVAHPDKK
ncbi:MAG: hypothetical protein M3362_28325 [Acidobacteriota bacterium]|nr:hypothetical protein [Acidobacteriota bacterium]